MWVCSYLGEVCGCTVTWVEVGGCTVTLVEVCGCTVTWVEFYEYLAFWKVETNLGRFLWVFIG